MIKIKKGNHELSVSKDAFKSMYKRLGYKEVSAKKVEAKPQPKQETKSEAKPEAEPEGVNPEANPEVKPEGTNPEEKAEEGKANEQKNKEVK